MPVLKLENEGHLLKESPQSGRERQKERTRRRFMVAAIDVIAEKGYSAVSVDDIVTTANSGRSTFYLHFQNKLDLMKALFDIEREQVFANYKELDDIAEPSKKQVRKWLDKGTQFWTRRGREISALLQAVAAEPDFALIHNKTLLEIVDSMENCLARWPEKDREKGRMRLFLTIIQLQQTYLICLNRLVSCDHDLAFDALSEEIVQVMFPQSE